MTRMASIPVASTRKHSRMTYTLPPSLQSHFPLQPRVPLLTFPVCFSLEAPYPSIRVSSSGRGPICLCRMGTAGVWESEPDQGV